MGSPFFDFEVVPALVLTLLAQTAASGLLIAALIRKPSEEPRPFLKALVCALVPAILIVPLALLFDSSQATRNMMPTLLLVHPLTLLALIIGLFRQRLPRAIWISGAATLTAWFAAVVGFITGVRVWG